MEPEITEMKTRIEESFNRAQAVLKDLQERTKETNEHLAWLKEQYALIGQVEAREQQKQKPAPAPKKRGRPKKQANTNGATADAK